MALVSAPLPQAVPAPGQLYQLIADTIPHIVWAARADGRVDFHNRRCLEYTGLDVAQLEGWGWKKMIHPDDWERCAASWTRALQSGERYEIEYRLRRADGAYRWHHGTAVPTRAADGHVARWFGTCTDIEAEVRSAQILEGMVEERTRALRAILDAEPECVKLLDDSGRLLQLNAAGLGMIESDSLEPLLGQCVYPLIADAHREAFRSLTERVCRGERGTLEFEMVGLKGTRRWLETHAVPFREESTGAMRLLAITRDITQRKRAEQALHESEQRSREYLADVRRLMGRLVVAQESERRRVADDLHDLIGQNLTALSIGLATLKAHPSADVRDAVTPRVDAMANLLEGTMDAIRGVMAELRPVALEEFGLLAALRWYATEFANQTGMQVRVNDSRREARYSSEVELALFRIVQEALTNAVKHSGGTKVEISLSERENVVRLVVEDDGQGFAEPAGARRAQRGGWGLPAMRERAEAHGGSLRVEFPPRGTRLLVDIPVPHGH